MHPPHPTDALPHTMREWEDAVNLSNPLINAARNLMKLEDPNRDWTRLEVIKGIKRHIDRIAVDDLGGLECLLGIQAQVTHVLFSQAVDKYATSPAPEKSAAYFDMALKAQNFCRMTAATIAYMKHMKTSKPQGGAKSAKDDYLLAQAQEVQAATLAGRAPKLSSYETWIKLTSRRE